MSLKLYRPTPDGLEPAPAERRDWRSRLRSRRWRPAALENAESDRTSPAMGALFFVGLAAITFIVLIVGYGTGFWA